MTTVYAIKYLRAKRACFCTRTFCKAAFISCFALLLHINGHTLDLRVLNQKLRALLDNTSTLKSETNNEKTKQNNFSDKVAKFCSCMSGVPLAPIKGKVPNQ